MSKVIENGSTVKFLEVDRDKGCYHQKLEKQKMTIGKHYTVVDRNVYSDGLTLYTVVDDEGADIPLYDYQIKLIKGVPNA